MSESVDTAGNSVTVDGQPEQVQQAACPDCGDVLLSITTTGPGEHYAGPCGCRVSSHRLARERVEVLG